VGARRTAASSVALGATAVDEACKSPCGTTRTRHPSAVAFESRARPQHASRTAPFDVLLARTEKPRRQHVLGRGGLCASSSRRPAQTKTGGRTWPHGGAPRSAPRVDRPVTASPGVRPILFERRSTDTSCFTRHFPPRQAADTDSTQPAWRRGADNTTFELTLRRVQVIGPFAAAHRTAQDYSAAGHIQSRVEALHRAATPRRPCAVAMAGASGGEPVRRQPAGDDSPSAAPLPQRPRGQRGCDRVVHLSYCKFAAKTGQ
jgi:hypothetical protein